MNRHHGSPQFLQRFHGSVISGALRTVHHDFHTVQIHGYRLNRMINVLLPGIGAVFDLAHRRTGRKLDIRHVPADQHLYFILQRIRQLIPVSVEKLDPVKFHRIVRSGNYHSRIHLILLRQISHCRCGQNAYKDAVRTHRTCPRHQRIGKHISGYSGITAHHNGWLMRVFLCQYIGPRLPQLHGKQRGEFLIGNTPYAVRPK